MCMLFKKTKQRSSSYLPKARHIPFSLLGLILSHHLWKQDSKSQLKHKLQEPASWGEYDADEEKKDLLSVVESSLPSVVESSLCLVLLLLLPQPLGPLGNWDVLAVP